MNHIVRDWYIPELREGKVCTTRGIDAHDSLLMWVIQDCIKCSPRDKKIAKLILDERLRELEKLIENGEIC